MSRGETGRSRRPTWQAAVAQLAARVESLAAPSTPAAVSPADLDIALGRVQEAEQRADRLASELADVRAQMGKLALSTSVDAITFAVDELRAQMGAGGKAPPVVTVEPPAWQSFTLPAIPRVAEAGVLPRAPLPVTLGSAITYPEPAAPMEWPEGRVANLDARLATLERVMRVDPLLAQAFTTAGALGPAVAVNADPGVATAGVAYTAAEQGMLQAVYDLARQIRDRLVAIRVAT